MRLTDHFSYAEVVRSETASRRSIDNTPPASLADNIRRMAQFMEHVRRLLGDRPLKVTSWYRSPALNTAIGGSKTSAHMRGLAVDFKPTGMSLREAFEIIARSDLGFDQLIYETTRSGAAWIHIGLTEGTARREVLTASGATLGGPMSYARVLQG